MLLVRAGRGRKADRPKSPQLSPFVRYDRSPANGHSDLGGSMDERQKEREYGFGRFWEYRNHIAYVVMGTSLGFPERDWEEQMTLDKAYDILRRGLPVSFDRIKDKDSIPEATSLLEASYAAFKQGDIKSGAHLLQDFDAKLLDLRRRRPKKAG